MEGRATLIPLHFHCPLAGREKIEMRNERERMTKKKAKLTKNEIKTRETEESNCHSKADSLWKGVAAARKRAGAGRRGSAIVGGVSRHRVGPKAEQESSANGSGTSRRRRVKAPGR